MSAEPSWLALHCACDGRPGRSSRSSPQEDEPWRDVEPHTLESMPPSP